MKKEEEQMDDRASEQVILERLVTSLPLLLLNYVCDEDKDHGS
jgi:hypothetical protein